MKTPPFRAGVTGFIWLKSKGLIFVSPAFAVDESKAEQKAELYLVSPSGTKFPGRPYQDGFGLFVVVNSPEWGEWTAEIIPKNIDNEENIRIFTGAAKGELGTVETKSLAPASSVRTRTFGIMTLVVLVLAVLATIGFIMWRKRIAQGLWNKIKTRKTDS